MGLHPTFTALLAAPCLPWTYRGWQIEFAPQEARCWAFEWSACHPDFDGLEGDDRIVHGPTREAVIARIDAWFREEVEL